MVLQGEEESTSGQAEDVVGGYVAPFPWQGLDVVEDWVAFLTRRNDDRAWSCSFWKSLRFGLDYTSLWRVVCSIIAGLSIRIRTRSRSGGIRRCS